MQCLHRVDHAHGGALGFEGRADDVEIRLGEDLDPLRAAAFVNLRTSVGFGFRWFSPIGPLRFEWGIPLYLLPGEDKIVFEFTIGNFF